MSRGRLEANEAHRVWIADKWRGLTTKTHHPVHKVAALHKTNIRNISTYSYFHPISGDGNDLPFVLRRMKRQAARLRLTAIKSNSHQVAPTPRCNLKVIE